MGYLKREVLISKPGTIEDLKQRIKEETAAILKQMTRRVMENRRRRLEQCLRNGGGHPNDELFENKMACNEFFSDNNIYVLYYFVLKNEGFFWRTLSKWTYLLLMAASTLHPIRLACYLPATPDLRLQTNQYCLEPTVWPDTCCSKLMTAMTKPYVTELVRNMPPLWDQRDKNYRDRDFKPNLWEETGEKLNVSTFSRFRYFKSSTADVLYVKRRFTAPSVSSPILKTSKGASLL
jgi:hypothetical protein